MIRKTYNTKRLVLRPYETTDYQAWALVHKNLLPQTYKYDWQPPKGFEPSRKAFQKVISKQKRNAAADRIYVFPIFEKKTGAWIGVIDIYIIDRSALQVANLGYRINNIYHRLGYAKEALLHLIPRILKDLKLNRLEAVIDPDNRPSTALARSAKLYREGIRKNYYYQNKRWEDQVVYVAHRKSFGLPILHPVD